MTGPRSTRWLLRDPSPDAAALLFMLPYLGAGASMYHAWPRRIGIAEVCPVQPPGREDRLLEPAPNGHRAFCEALVRGLAPIIDRPFAFFGHCASAYIGFEAATHASCLLGNAPAVLFVSSMGPPHEAQRAPILELEAAGVLELAGTLVARRHGTIEPDLVALATEALTADLTTYRDYARPGATRAPCPIVAIGWDRDQEIPAEALAGWASYAPRLDHIVLPGDHWSFLSAPLVLQDVLAAMFEAA